MENIKTIIVRCKEIDIPKTRMNFTVIKTSEIYKNKDDLFEKYKIESLLEDICFEKLDSSKLELSLLYQSCLEISDGKTFNEYFKKIYQLQDDLAVDIDNGHVHICRIFYDFEIEGEQILPWYYTGNRTYLCDTWWATNEEIINDLKNKAFIEFVNDYKCFS